MRTVSSCLLILVAAAIAAAQTCTAPASDVFSTSGASGCTTISTCQTALCACIGGSGSFSTCLNSNSKTCTQVATCYASYFTCLLGTTSVRANSTDACSTYGNTLYIGQLAVAAASSINTTSMYQSCVYNVCLLQNATGSASSCSLASSVCTSAVLLSGTSTPAPTNAVGNTTEILVTLRISGDWTAILADATKKASVTAALLVDLAKLLGIESRFIKIQSLTSGSLVVQFGVFSGSGVSVATLASAVNAAQGSSSWLGSTSTAYTAAGGTGSLTTLSVSATTAAPGQTLAPGATSPPASPSSAMGAAGMWAAAAVAAVAALMA